MFKDASNFAHNELKRIETTKGTAQHKKELVEPLNAWSTFSKNYARIIAPKYLNAHVSRISIPDENGKVPSYKDKISVLVKEPRSLFLSGPAGRGKTYWMFAYLRALFDANMFQLSDVRFFRSVDLDNTLSVGIKTYGSNSNLINDLAEYPLLIIDDFGMERSGERSERDVYDLLDRRTSFDRMTVLSTNLLIEDIQKIFGERIASRLQTFTVINFFGPDLRQQETI